LRIVVSVFFGVLAVALCVLWLRSTRLSDNLLRYGANHWMLELHSDRGAVRLVSRPLSLDSRPVTRWKYRATGVEPSPLRFTFGFRKVSNRSYLMLPYWMLVLTLGVLSFVAIPRHSYSNRFSLRTLFIATTLVAIVLGLVGYTIR
jgi:hypothetical protein